MYFSFGASLVFGFLQRSGCENNTKIINWNGQLTEVYGYLADLVDGALAGLAAGEAVTIPPLQDGEDWNRFESARQEFAPKFQNNRPGSRYLAHA
jgi:hypothetical protein